MRVVEIILTLFGISTLVTLVAWSFWSYAKALRSKLSLKQHESVPFVIAAPLALLVWIVITILATMTIIFAGTQYGAEASSSLNPEFASGLTAVPGIITFMILSVAWSIGIGKHHRIS